MPHLPPRICPSCRQPTPQGADCPTCHPPWTGAAPRLAPPNSHRWRRARTAKLRDNPFCERPGCHRIGDDVDHITALALGGHPYDRANLQTLCKPHHKAKTQADMRLLQQAAQTRRKMSPDNRYRVEPGTA